MIATRAVSGPFNDRTASVGVSFKNSFSDEEDGNQYSRNLGNGVSGERANSFTDSRRKVKPRRGYDESETGSEARQGPGDYSSLIENGSIVSSVT